MTATLDSIPSAEGPSSDGTAESASSIVQSWLDAFAAALAEGDAEAAAQLIQGDGWWRDLLAFTWDLRTAHGVEQIRARLQDTVQVTGPRDFELAGDLPPQLVEADANTTWVQAFFTFNTAVASCRGFVRLTDDGSGWKAWTLLTSMEQLTGHEERTGQRRDRGTNHGMHRGRTNWLDERAEHAAYEHSEPDVVVVGAGQGGLALAARLGRLDVDTLIVERNARVGDSWRRRYHSLVLHDPVWYDHLPYLSFPSSWPVFTPKDKLANWFELYAEVMELNVWTSTTLDGATYDESTQRWTVAVIRADGTTRELHPRHLVLATGVSGVPNIPQFAGQEDFRGEIMHSSQFQGGKDLSGRKALVVGSCNSGHDIAQELNEQGAEVTMLQRSSTYVMSSEAGIRNLFAGTYEEGGPPVDEADLMFASFPYPLVAELHKGVTAQIAIEDKEMIEGLESAGFKLDYGEDGSGLFMKYLRRGGGYYIDVGCAALIASGEVAIKQGVEIERFTPDGVVFTDRSTMSLDIVVLATGYQNMRESARVIIGANVADNCQPVWGLDEEGELRTVWRRSGQEGFWFMGGNLHQSRHYSRFLALQIKAMLEGIVDTSGQH